MGLLRFARNDGGGSAYDFTCHCEERQRRSNPKRAEEKWFSLPQREGVRGREHPHLASPFKGEGWAEWHMMLYNTFIDKRDLALLARQTSEMMAFDPYLRDRLLDESIDGLKAWEYGKLVSFIGDFTGLSVLDIGPGDSSLCLFLAQKGAKVTTIDYSQPMAPQFKSFRERCRQKGVGLTCGNMLNLPYKDEVFDLVLCISTIEHLDITPDWKPIPYRDSIALTKRALLEMGRVIKKGGYLYLTSDAYDPQRQKTDNWSLGAIYDGIGAAYSVHDIKGVFVNTLEGAGLTLVKGHDYSPGLLDDPQRCNYRGRYFTTFCVLAQKGG